MDPTTSERGRTKHRADAATLPKKPVHLYAVPPTDREKYLYLGTSQHRWFWWTNGAAFAGVAISLFGFSTVSYWTLIFLVPLAVYAAETLLGLRTSTFRRRVTHPDHELRVQLWNPEHRPSIDIFLPTCGEPLELLTNTWHYVSRLEWSGELKVHVLDDACRPELADIAERYGFRYLARPGNAHKKAGNLQYAFERTGGDHIVIFDADFVPRADFLRELIPYMDMPDVGIVQSPQYFSTSRHMNWMERCAGATQELFYRMIQPSRDAVGAAICVGTSAVYRRVALAEIGGFPLVGHSEDVYTGLELARQGYRLQYVPVVVSRGICPDDVNSFITQQYRWCEGSLQLMSSLEFHGDQRMTGRQRMSFWSGFVYYISTAMNGFFAPIPALVMIWLLPQFVAPSNLIPLIGVLVLWLAAYPLVMHGRWRLDVLRVQTIYAFAHGAAIWDVFFGTAAEWVPSHGSARPAPLSVRVRRMMGWYLLVTQVLVIGGLSWRLLEDGWQTWWAAGLFVLMNAYIFVPVVWVSFGGRMRSNPHRRAHEQSVLETDRSGGSHGPAPESKGVGQ